MYVKNSLKLPTKNYFSQLSFLDSLHKAQNTGMENSSVIRISR